MNSDKDKFITFNAFLNKLRLEAEAAEAAEAAKASDNVCPMTTEESKAKPVLKICCACPDTKFLRDNCVIEKSQEECKVQIEAHKQCLRDAGFDV